MIYLYAAYSTYLRIAMIQQPNEAVTEDSDRDTAFQLILGPPP